MATYGSGLYGSGLYGSGDGITINLDMVVEEIEALPISVFVQIPLQQVVEEDEVNPIVALKEPDPFSLPTAIAGISGMLQYNMVDATLETGEPNPNNATGTYWLTWQPPDFMDGELARFHTRGSNADTSLAVFTGDSMGALVEVVTEDNNPSADYADVTWTVAAGTAYRIQVGVKGSSEPTDISITWMSGQPQAYDPFASPLLLETQYGSAEFTNTNNTVEVGEPVPAGSIATSWLEWEATTDEFVNFQFRAISDAPYTVRVYSGSSLGALSQVVEVSGTGTLDVGFDPTFGAVYKIQVATQDDLDAGFEVSWSVVADPVPPAPYPYPTPVAGDPLPLITLRAEVYERDGATLITEVPRRVGVSGMEPLNVVGSGGMAIPLNDPVLQAYPDLLRYGNVVKFFIGDTCVHGFKIRRRKTKLVSSSEFSGLTKEVYGPSLQYMMEDFMVTHDGPTRPDSHDVRFFSWASPPNDEWYKPGQWDAGILSWSLDDPPSNKKKNKPKNWKVKTAKWIRPPQGGGGWRYLRKTWHNDTEGRLVRLMATADEWWSLYLDGELIMSGDKREIGYTEFKRYDTVLSKGKHTIAVVTRAFPSSKGDGNDSFLFAMSELDLDGKLMRPALLVSNESWEAHVGNPPPGWNRAAVLRTVVKEAKARGVESAVNLSLDFTSTHDSDGVKWPNTQFNQEVKIGTSGLNLQAQLSEGNGFDVWVDPADMSIKAWVRRGEDKSASVTLEPGRNLIDWEVDEVDEVLNHWLIQYEGGWTEYNAKGSQGDYETRESFVSLGNIKDEDSAKKLMKRAAEGIARAQNRAGTGDITKRPEGQPGGGLIGVEGAYPFLDFNVGDIIKGPNADGKLVKMRVLAISFTEDANGYLSFDPELEEIKSV